MTNENYARAYVEVLACLNQLNEEEYNRIPQKIIRYFEENKDNTYNFNIDVNTLNKTKLSEEANAINLYIYMNYFSTEEVNKKIKNQLVKNEKKHQEMLSKKYNTENLFKKNKQDFENKEVLQKPKTVQMVKYKKLVFDKFIKKIKKAFERLMNK